MAAQILSFPYRPTQKRELTESEKFWQRVYEEWDNFDEQAQMALLRAYEDATSGDALPASKP